MGRSSAVREQDSDIFGDLMAWVEGYLSPVYRRKVGDAGEAAWCAEWYRHAEAAVRLDAMWRSWEYYRHDRTQGLSLWFLDHADAHMAALLDRAGPFKLCGIRGSHQDAPVPPKPPPPDAEQDHIHTGAIRFGVDYLIPVYRERITDAGTRWCPEWWKHAEAVARLEAMRQSWEHFRSTGGPGMSVWLLDHADPHMNTLLDRYGPFRYCHLHTGHQDRLRPLPVEAPPPEMFLVAHAEPETVADASETNIPVAAVPISAYDDVAEFVEKYLSQVYRRQVFDSGDTVWCPRWWMHAEAVTRLDSLRRAWDRHRSNEETGVSTWLLDHVDPHMRQLFDRRGTFKFCSARTGHGHALNPLPLTPPTPASWNDPFDGPPRDSKSDSTGHSTATRPPEQPTR
ncbi:DUF4913 domain-containing protein [Nocardia puris]|uniref:DUF4913 domain-containing protein n=1 Tax=Nocardia puris TaxID=208602 RepID=UPI001E5111FE|nr:DUF4913 domain-containing protein [Nocardia puris]